jgi:hypothetical protein
MRNISSFLVVAILALTGCISRLRLDEPPVKTSLATDRVQLAAVFTDGRPYVDLRVNGTGPYRFLVDTGSAGTSITSQVARAAGISFSRRSSANVLGASGHFEAQFMAIVDRIESPGVSFEMMAVTILTPESATLLAPHHDTLNGGVIGMSTLRNVRLEIDYPQKTISLIRLEQEPPSAIGIPYTENQPHVTIAIPSSKPATTTALIDTGADGGFYFTELTSYPSRVGWIKADTYQHGIGGYWRPLFGQLEGDIRLGSAIWRDPVIHSADGNRIGSAGLAPWKLVIDQQSKMLWLLEENQINTTTWTGPLEPDGRPAVFGFGVIAEGDAFVIKEVDPGSRAERAGLRIGDVVLPQDEVALADERVRRSDPYLARLRIVRGGEMLEITMSLSTQLPGLSPPTP